ncbi:MAG: trypco2 family protein [Pseudomonadota bacterium]
MDLSKLIVQAAEELEAAVSERSNSKKVMRFEECEIEAKVSLSVTAAGKLNIGIVELGGDGDRQSMSTIRMKFSAVDPSKPVEKNDGSSFKFDGWNVSTPWPNGPFPDPGGGVVLNQPKLNVPTTFEPNKDD